MGPEAGMKDDALNDIRVQLGMPKKEYGMVQSPREGEGGGEENLYYATETPAHEIADAIQNGALFAAKRLFIIKNADKLGGVKKEEKEGLRLLTAALAALDADTVVVCMTDEIRVSETLKKAFPPSNVRTFWELDERRKGEWVENFFRRSGFRINGDGVQTILELVENNTAALGRECGRLTLFLDRAKPVDAEAVEKWLSHTREESAFTLFSRIAAGDLEKSLDAVRAILGTKESPVSLLAGLAWCCRRLRDYLALRDAGKANNDFELKRNGFASPTARRDYAAAASRYASAEPALALIAEYDLRLREAGAVWESMLLDRLVCELVSMRPANIT
jgi:DNA polymerase-3 subunit delta